MTDQGPESSSSDAHVDNPDERYPVELEMLGGTTAADGPAEPHAASEESLTVPADYRPQKRADVLELDMGDGAILYDNDASLVHHLNPSATLIWQLCDGSGRAQDLARDIAEEYALDLEAVGEQVMTVIAELDALGLVEDARGSEQTTG